MYEARNILEMAQKLQSERTSFALVTVINSEAPTSAHPGSKAIVEADGTIHGWIGGGCAQPAVIKTVEECLNTNKPKHIRVSATSSTSQPDNVIEFISRCHSGGSLELFIDPFITNPSLTIYGNSPVARNLAQLAPVAGFDVTIVTQDDNEHFPAGCSHHHEFDLSIPDSSQSPAFNDTEFVVVATQGKVDLKSLHSALNSSSRVVSFVASQRKATKLKNQLAEKGFTPATLSRISTPAGIDIGAVTPAEIAVSILAGLIQQRRASKSQQENPSNNNQINI